MEHLRGFEIDVLPACYTKGRRVKIFDTRHEQRKIISWDYTFNSSLEIATNYLKSRGISIVAFAYNEKTHKYTALTPDFMVKMLEDSQ